jgi:hypothetical protein
LIPVGSVCAVARMVPSAETKSTRLSALIAASDAGAEISAA